MTNIELIPLVPDAADRLREAIRRYEEDAMTIHEAYKVAVSVYGVEGALTAFTLSMSDATKWRIDDQDIETKREHYGGPLVPGYDFALEHALRSKLGLPRRQPARLRGVSAPQW